MLPNWQGGGIRVNATPPSETITLFYDPKICMHQKSQGLKLFKIDSGGELIPTIKKDILFQVIDINNLKPFASIIINDRDRSGSYVL